MIIRRTHCFMIIFIDADFSTKIIGSEGTPRWALDASKTDQRIESCFGNLNLEPKTVLDFWT